MERMMNLGNYISDMYKSVLKDDGGLFKYTYEDVQLSIHRATDIMSKYTRLKQDLKMLKAYDEYTLCHSVHVAVLSAITGLKMGYNEYQLAELVTSALLHDIGKIQIPIKVLNKKGILSKEEFEVIKMHPQLGYEYVKRNYLNASDDMLKGIYQHHERVDGSGYPQGLIRTEIAEYSKIIAVCDVYDALTTNRPYHNAYIPSEAIEYLYGCQDLDEKIIYEFIHSIYAYPKGTCVKLSDGQRGVVIRNHREYPCRPVLNLQNGAKCNLLEDKYLNVTIIGVLKSKEDIYYLV